MQSLLVSNQRLKNKSHFRAKIEEGKVQKVIAQRKQRKRVCYNYLMDQKLISKSSSLQGHKEKVNDLKRKMKLLKQAVKQQRSANQHLEDELYLAHEDLKKKQMQSRRRDEKNEGLVLQIRKLRDDLLAQKNQRMQLQTKLQTLVAREVQGAQGGKMSMSNYFGLKTLFQR